ncbi:MAG: DEAD/DEAH box helicase, partial [Clostridiales bacterium]|nr:DEAD/DEAH box helicase [Clostridiales bacterium]
MNIEQYIEHLQNSPSFMQNVAAWRVLPAREARYADFPEGLNGQLVEALGRRGIGRPYIHQRLAIEAAISSEDLVVVTPTASGKTLCYNVPVLDAILANESNRALY